MTTFHFHPGQVALGLVALALLLYGLYQVRRGKKRLAYVMLGAALAQFALLFGVIDFGYSYIALWNEPRWEIYFAALDRRMISVPFTPETVERFSWLLPALGWLGLALFTMLGAGAGLAVAVESERCLARGD